MPGTSGPGKAGGVLTSQPDKKAQEKVRQLNYGLVDAY